VERLKNNKSYETYLEVRNLRTYFFTRKGVIKAVDDVSFSVSTGEIHGIVGESGCGKSMTALSIMRLVPFPGRIVGGEILFKGVNLLSLKEEEMRLVRLKHISMVLQDPVAALDPLFTLGNQLGEVLLGKDSHGMKRRKVVDMLRRVRLARPEYVYSSYPHELSGGMNQRCAIGMSLLPEPDLLIADEPTTALDVTIQAQVLLLLKELLGKSSMGMILITHDLGVVAMLCTKVSVMYSGRIVEKAPVHTLFKKPAHPYTKGLLHALPQLSNSGDALPTIPGQPSMPSESSRGCLFADRCSAVLPVCREESPPEIEVGQDHWVSCWAI
jgi:peptide/nickel transport system ATP-binding protein